MNTNRIDSEDAANRFQKLIRRTDLSVLWGVVSMFLTFIPIALIPYQWRIWGLFLFIIPAWIVLGAQSRQHKELSKLTKQIIQQTWNIATDIPALLYLYYWMGQFRSLDWLQKNFTAALQDHEGLQNLTLSEKQLRHLRSMITPGTPHDFLIVLMRAMVVLKDINALPEITRLPAGDELPHRLTPEVKEVARQCKADLEAIRDGIVEHDSLLRAGTVPASPDTLLRPASSQIDPKKDNLLKPSSPDIPQ